MSEQKTFEIPKRGESAGVARRITRIDDPRVTKARPPQRRGSERFAWGGG